jgi:peroxiredoxin
MVKLPEGQPAPKLRLPALSGDGTFDLAQYRGSRPVVLVFASFT